MYTSDPDDPGYDAIADWDDGEYHVNERDDGHVTVSGSVDGSHYQRSWDADGSRDHSRLDKETGKDGRHWTVDHD